jgi:hypothetical protein
MRSGRPVGPDLITPSPGGLNQQERSPAHRAAALLCTLLLRILDRLEEVLPSWRRLTIIFVAVVHRFGMVLQ